VLPLYRAPRYTSVCSATQSRGVTGHARLCYSLRVDDKRKLPTRRDVNRTLALAAGSAALPILGCNKKADPAILIPKAGELEVGGSLVFAYPEPDKPCYLIRPAADTYRAFSRLCTHHQCPVFYAPTDNQFNCPCHGGVFSATNGAALAGPPPTALPQVKLERRGSDLVAVGFLPEPPPVPPT
jgi:Rieske Fe-S protein